MAINTILIKGYIKDGKLQADVPDDLPDGEVNVTIELPSELDDMLNFRANTPGEIWEAGLVGIGAWADMEIGDSEEWVQEQRRKRRDERQARWIV